VPSFQSIFVSQHVLPWHNRKEKSGHATAPTAIVSATMLLAQIAAAQNQQ
jgi:hypothetical protein